MSDNDKLLRCPFCGGEAHVTCSADAPQYHMVSCKYCGLQAQWYHDNKEEAIEHWNTRTTEESGILKQITSVDLQLTALKVKKEELRNELQEVQSRMKNSFIRDNCTM